MMSNSSLLRLSTVTAKLSVITKWQLRLIHVILLTCTCHKASNYNRNADLSEQGVIQTRTVHKVAVIGSLALHSLCSAAKKGQREKYLIMDNYSFWNLNIRQMSRMNVWVNYLFTLNSFIITDNCRHTLSE